MIAGAGLVLWSFGGFFLGWGYLFSVQAPRPSTANMGKRMRAKSILFSPCGVLLHLVVGENPSFSVVFVKADVSAHSCVSGIGFVVKVIPEAFGNLVKFSRIFEVVLCPIFFLVIFSHKLFSSIVYVLRVHGL